MKFGEKIKSWKKVDPEAIARSIGRFWEVTISKEIDIKTKRKLLMSFKSQKMELLKEIELPNNVTPLDYKIKKETSEEIPDEVLELKKEMDIARAEKNWQEVDKLHNEIKSEGYIIDDTDTSTKIRKNLH
jgi:cysteinyl-tRNA synthetase